MRIRTAETISHVGEVSAIEKAQAGATASAQRTLERAATFAGLHATAKPLFQKTMRVGSRRLLVRLVWPGVLLVCDPATGEVLAQSERGQPAVLAAHFRALAERDLAPRIS